MAPPRGRKPGLLARLGIKKSKNPDHRLREAESPSRRDIPLERSRLELDPLRGDGMVNGNHGITTTIVSAGNPEPSRPSKLVKRNSKRQSTGPDPWPLRPNSEEEESLQPVADSHTAPLHLLYKRRIPHRQQMVQARHTTEALLSTGMALTERLQLRRGPRHPATDQIRIMTVPPKSRTLMTMGLRHATS